MGSKLDRKKEAADVIFKLASEPGSYDDTVWPEIEKTLIGVRMIDEDRLKKLRMIRAILVEAYDLALGGYSSDSRVLMLECKDMLDEILNGARSD